MRKKQIFLYLALFIAALVAMVGIAFGVRQAIRAGNLAGIDWYDVNGKEFVISTEQELYEFAALSDYYDFAGQTIKLGADIVVNDGNAEDWYKEAPAKKWQPITEFAGTFDGQGHSISGLYGKSSSMSMGLFSETKEGCVIQDFKLLNSFFTNTTNNGLGSILGEGTGEIKQVYSDAIIYGEGESNGGIAGLIKANLTLTECWFDGQVIGEQRSNGGMIGWVDRKSNVVIDNCLNSGLIKFIGEGNSKTGGFIGGISDIAYRTDVSLVSITNSMSTGKIDVTNTSYAGAAVGRNSHNGALTFENTYAVIEITDNAASETTVGTNNGKLTGNAVPRFRETLMGVGGYQWTDLDFENYWACVEGETPVLKYFAKDALSLDGVAKAVDTSWYKEGQTEFVLNDVADFWGFAMLSANTKFDGVTIKLGADITVNETDSSLWKETPPEYNWFPIYSFSGIFDGQGHTISGIYCYTNARYIGLFKQVNANGSVENFKLLNSYFRATYCVGAVSGHGGGSISKIYTDATVENTGEHTAGILGAMNQTGTLANCWFDGEVIGGTSYTGGITSAAMSGMCVVSHCLNTGTVYGGTKHSTGGLVGLVNNTLTISDSLNAGKVDDSKSSNKARTGSVIGRILDNCKANISSTYTTKESYETSIGQGYPTSGAPFVNTEAELKGNGGYRRTILNFEKFWAIDKDGHPTLQAFAEEIPSLPNVKRPFTADTKWFDEDESVFVLTTAEQLYGLVQLTGTNDFEGKTIKLGKNINLNSGSASQWANGAPQNQWASINSFNGTFDGCGYTISGLYMNDGLWRVGLFGNVPAGAVIKNVKVTNSYMEAAYHIGSAAGWLQESTVSGVYSDAIIVARKGHAGGVVGTTNHGVIENTWFDGLVDTTCDYVGGICSFISGDAEKPMTKMSNCLNTGTVKGKSNVGGLVGRVATDARISYSLGAGPVNGSKYVGAAVGRVVNEAVCDIAEGVYATKESADKSFGSGNPNGAVITYEKALLSGDGGYQRTILDFNKYWGVVANDTPVLKKFGGKAPANPNVTRATKPDTSWYDAKKTTFVLNDYADLYGLAVLSGSATDFKGKTIKLGNNITGNSGTAADFAENAPLNQWIPISKFAGTFDGQGKTIQGFSANHDTGNNIALFGITKAGAVIKDLEIKNSYFSGNAPAASVTAQAIETTLKDIYSEAIVNAVVEHGAGITGTMSGAVAENCWFNGKVTIGKNYGGGITSFVSGDKASTISHCLNTGTIKGKSQIAGIVGRVAQDVKVTDSLNTGLINAPSNSASVIGLVYGDAKVTLDAVYGTRESGSRVLSKGTYEGTAALYLEYHLTDYSACTVTELDFDKYWIAKAGEMPQLRSFVDTSDALNHKAVVQLDTSWYSESKKSYTLMDKADLYGFAFLVNTGNDFAGKTVRLGANITLNTEDAATYATTPPKYKWTPIGSTANSTKTTLRFAGTFDGKDTNGKRHYISGLCTDTPDTWFVGLFGATDGATIKNVEIKNSYFAGLYYTASAAGMATNTNVRTVYSDAIIANKAVNDSGNSGGIIGGLSTGKIDDVWFDGSITTQGQFVGGIVGVSFNESVNTFSNCLNTGAITSTRTSGNLYTGGLIGGAQDTFTMSQCVSAGDKPISAKNARVGSIIGNHDKDAVMSNVYAASNVFVTPVGDNGDKDAILTLEPEVVANLDGYNAYTYTKLDFGMYWSLVEKEAPQLTSFASGKLIALDNENLFRPDTAWVTQAVADSEGNPAGSEENPYIIMDRGDLYGFAELVNGGENFYGQYVRLGNDITVNKGSSKDWADGEEADYAWTPIGQVSAQHFMGTFDGTNLLTNVMHKISGLYMSEDKVGGLFVDVDDATIKNFTLENSYFGTDEGSAAVAGWNCGGTFDTIKVASDVFVENKNSTKGIRNHAAGIVGLINEEGTTVNNCWFDGTLSGQRYIGGITSYISADNVEITNCLVTGEITSTGKDTGGLLGLTGKAVTIKDSLVACRKEINSSATSNVGAVVGGIGTNASVENVYATKATYQKASGTNLDVCFWLVENLSGWFGYKHSYLDFDNNWYAMSDSEPRLQAFTAANSSKILDTTSILDWYSKAAAGVGNSKENPYLINNELELYSLAKLVNTTENFAGKYIKLNADITFTDGSIWTPMGPMLMFENLKADYSGAFQGTFDGDNHKLIGMKVDSNSRSIHGDKVNDVNTVRNGRDWYLGFIGVAWNATVKNLEILDSTVSGKYNTGTFVGVGENVVLENLHTDGTVTMTAGQAGGIIGNMTGGQIKGCWNKGTVTVGTHGYAGGLAGMAGGTKVTIEESRNTGNVVAGGGYVGGLLGNTTVETEIRVSMNSGNVTGGKDRIGGLLGNTTQKTSILSSMNSGNVASSGSYIGGFVGHSSYKLEIGDCLSTGTVSGKSQVGLGIGQQNGGEAELVNLNTETIVVVKNGSTLKPLGRNWGLHIYDNSGAKLGEATCMTTVNTSDDIKGIAGYTGTGLAFDRPETPDVQEGYWVARKDDTPALKCFTSEDQILDLRGTIKADTTWSKVATKETINGAEVDTYTINRPEELVGLSTLVNNKNCFDGAVIYLGADIILNEATRADAVNWAKGTVDTSKLYKWTPIGKIATTTGGWTNDVSAAFKGTFDGQGHTISGLYAPSTSAGVLGSGWLVGLFGWAYDATITDVNVVNSYIAGAYHVAAIAGRTSLTDISNCYTNAIVRVSDYQGGGITGSASGAEISGCWFDGTVSDGTAGGNYSFLGGIVGVTGADTEITNCLNTGTITGVQPRVGGLVGEAQGALTITDSLNAGVVSGAGNTGSVLGNLVKAASVNVIDGYAYVPTGFAIGSASGTVKKNGTTITNSTSTSTEKNNNAFTRFTRLDQKGGWVGYNTTAYPGLDFTNTWVTTVSTPILKQFAQFKPYYVADTEWEGEGTESSPYMITIPQELYGFAKVVNAKDAQYMSAYFKLGADIVLNDGSAADYATYAPTYRWTPLGTWGTADNFAGILDGGEFTISGLYINAPYTTGTGFFTETETGAVVKDLKLVNSYISGDQGVGSFGGWYTAGTFQNLYSDAILVAQRDHTGGIVGLPAADTDVINCWSAASISSKSNYVGGIAGSFLQANVSIENCLFTGEIKAAKDQAGGIVGRIGAAGSLTDCLAAPKSAITGASNVGAVVGWFNTAPDFTDVYATNIAAASVVGNKAGQSFDGCSIVSTDYTGAIASSTFSGLDFQETWITTANGTPILAKFEDLLEEGN